MPTFRVEFSWTSAMPRRSARGNCYRFGRSVHLISKPSTFEKQDLAAFSRLIGEEAVRRGMKDVHIKVRHVSLHSSESNPAPVYGAAQA